MPELLSIIQKDNRTGTNSTSLLGHRGEQMAADLLSNEGYRIVVSNFKVPVGRNSKGVQVTGEIDLIALDGETICFIEVKTRRSKDFTPVITNVDLRKQRQIMRTAKVYRRIFGVWDMKHRYDVVTVLMPKHADAEIEITKGFWNESNFRKRRWNHTTWQEFY
jgi:putative endonuclease